MFKALRNFFFKERKEPEENPRPLLLSPPKTEENKEMRKSKETTDIMEKEKTQEISLPKIVNSEVNLLVFPFFALDKKRQRKRTKVEYQDVVKKGNERIEILWQVTSNSEYRYPGLFDREVHKAIEQIITEILRKNRKVVNPISLGSLNSLLKKAGVDPGGFQYGKVKKSLERIRATTIKSVGTFYSKEGKQWIDDNFGLYDRIVFKGKELPNGEIADTNYLFLGSRYLQSLNSFYIKPIDYSYLQSLRSKIASRLYEILGVKFYGLRNKREGFICYRYSKLCQLLPVTPFKQISRAKQQLDPAHNELRATRFLFNYKWDKNSDRDWLIYYWPGKRAKKEMRGIKTESFKFLPIEKEILPKPKKKPQSFSKSQINLVNELVKLNVSEITAEDLVKHSSEQAIRKWVKGIHYTKAKDKAAYLVKAIRENWQVPEEYLKTEEREKQRKEQEKIKIVREKKEEEERRKRQEETKKLDGIYNSLHPLKQKEVKREIEKRLPSFIKNQFEKEMRKKEISKFTMSVLKGKKREVIKEWIASGKIKSEKEGV